jgi:hypothetical protein
MNLHCSEQTRTIKYLRLPLSMSSDQYSVITGYYDCVLSQHY